VLFAFRHSQQYDLPAPTIRLLGLDAKAVYTLKHLDGRSEAFSGEFLMSNGLDLILNGDYGSTVVVLTRQ